VCIWCFLSMFLLSSPPVSFLTSPLKHFF
jgi:hypothetical protein